MIWDMTLDTLFWLSIQRMQYYPSGLPWLEAYSPSEQPWKYNGKEFVEMHGLDEYDSKARWYYPAICRTTTMDPLAETYYGTSPYAWCGNNTVRFVDPDGRRPVYNTNGDFLGTDDEGLQGDAIIMSDDYFKQRMSTCEALSYHLGESGLVDEKAQEKFNHHYSQLNTRPDWDGYLTLDEANDWYRYGGGEPLYVDLGQIDMSGILSLGENSVGQQRDFNLLMNSNSIETGLVYGNVTLKRYSNHQVRAYADTYDFEMHSWKNPLNWGRNIETIIGSKVAGQGVSYVIHFYGSQTLTPILPWIK